jgi:Flp pilus assembly protein protease CpaA
LGLATGVVGLLAGTVMLRVVRFVFTTGLGVEALGLGDADLMMMAGAFLGWQPLVVAFFISVGPGLFFALVHMLAQRVATRQSITIAGTASLENAEVTVVLDGQKAGMEQIGSTIATLAQERHKSVLAFDPTELEEFVDNVVKTVRATAREAGIRKVRVPSHDVPPGWLARTFALLVAFPRRAEKLSIQLEASVQDGKPVFRLNGQPVLQEDLARSLSAIAAGRRSELILDSGGTERWLEQTTSRIRLAARQAGIDRIHVHDRTIPFGPALAVGLVVAMLGWRSIAAQTFFVFFHAWLVFGAAGVCCILMLACSYFIRVSRLLRG